ncbi:hypothetical protein VaNZ11_012794, partial [Volvox africanus]
MAVWNDYTWIVVTGCLAAFFTAYGIGANDVANAFGSSVAARTLTMRQALLIATVCEFSGSVLLGGGVTRTVASGIAKLTAFEQNPEIYMYGMLCALVSSGTWLIIATYLELPVSTTHSIAGAVLGFAFVYGGPKAVVWLEPQEEFPYMKGMVPIVVSWFVSPLISGLATAFLFFLVRTAILRRERSLDLAFWALPLLVLFTVFVNVYFVLYKGADTRVKWSSNKCAWVSACAAGGCTVLTIIFVMPLVRYYVYQDIEARRLQQLSEMESHTRGSSRNNRTCGSGGAYPVLHNHSIRSVGAPPGGGGVELNAAGSSGSGGSDGSGARGGGNDGSGARGSGTMVAAALTSLQAPGAATLVGDCRAPPLPPPARQRHDYAAQPPQLQTGTESGSSVRQQQTGQPMSPPSVVPPTGLAHSSYSSLSRSQGNQSLPLSLPQEQRLVQQQQKEVWEPPPPPQQQQQHQQHHQQQQRGAPGLVMVNFDGGAQINEEYGGSARYVSPPMLPRQQTSATRVSVDDTHGLAGGASGTISSGSGAVLGDHGQLQGRDGSLCLSTPQQMQMQQVPSWIPDMQQQQQQHQQQQLLLQQQWLLQQQPYLQLQIQDVRHPHQQWALPAQLYPQELVQQHPGMQQQDEQQQCQQAPAVQMQRLPPSQQNPQWMLHQIASMQSTPSMQSMQSTQLLPHQQVGHWQAHIDTSSANTAAGMKQGCDSSMHHQYHHRHQSSGPQPPPSPQIQTLTPPGPIAESLEWGWRSVASSSYENRHDKRAVRPTGGGGAAAVTADAAAGNGSGEAPESNVQWQNTFDQLKAIVLRGTQVKVHEAILTDPVAQRMHTYAEVFDPATEDAFKYLQVVTAICDSFSHGANDVANSVGPLAAIWYIYRFQRVDYLSDLPIWILVIGGAGIVMGLATYGYNIMRAIGVRLSVITPSRGFCIELSTALVVAIASKYGLPISTTHCQVGATAGMGLMEGTSGLHWSLVLQFFIGWVVTLLLTGLMGAALFASGAFAPSILQSRDLQKYETAILNLATKIDLLVNRTNYAALSDPRTWGNFSAALNATVTTGIQSLQMYGQDASTANGTRPVQHIDPSPFLELLETTMSVYYNNTLPYIGGMTSKGIA